MQRRRLSPATNISCSLRQRSRRKVAPHFRCQSLSCYSRSLTIRQQKLARTAAGGPSSDSLESHVHARSGIAGGDHSVCGEILRHPAATQNLFGRRPVYRRNDPREIVNRSTRSSALESRLRLREAYVMRGLREEQLALAVAEAAGPIRSCAATLLELQDLTRSSPKEALENSSKRRATETGLKLCPGSRRRASSGFCLPASLE